MAISPNASKSWLTVKDKFSSSSADIFVDTDIKMTNTGKRFLGAAIGTRFYVERFVRKRVSSWIDDINNLPIIALCQHHTVYLVYTHGLLAKWTYFSQTIPDCECCQ